MTMQDIIERNIKIRYEILRSLYELDAENKSFSWEDFGKQSNYSNEEVRKALNFLKEEYLINYIQTMSSFLNVKLTSEGSKLVEKIEQAKISDKKIKDKVIDWAKNNVSWIVPIIVDLVKS